MKNPFEKEDHTGLVVTVVIGSLAAAGIAYLFLNKTGDETFEKLKHTLKEGLKDVASTIISNKTNISKKTVKAVADHVVK